MVKVILPDAVINGMSIREINRHFRNEDDSDKWPICGKFNVTERAIRRIRRWREYCGNCEGGLEYYLAMEHEISDIINDERNW